MHRLIPIGVFVGAYMVGFGALALAQREGEFLYYWGVMAVLVAAIVVLDRRVGLSTGVMWGLAVWGGVHMAGGLVPIPQGWAQPGLTAVLYNMRPHPDAPKFDQAVHAYGFCIATLAAWECLRAGGLLRPTPGLRVLMVCAGMGLGALNEVVEFAATRLLPQTNVGGYENTGWDLVSNLVGCVLAAGFLRGNANPSRRRCVEGTTAEAQPPAPPSPP